jgi:hypothetical protein
MPPFIVCVPFYSLPEFPKICRIIKNHNVILRDVLLCNKTNTIHIEAGIQFDPHIETQEYKYCEPRVRAMLMKRQNDYDELYILFRTRYLHLYGPSKYYVVGYYEMEKKFTELIDSSPVIHAKRIKFVSITDAIDVSKRIVRFKAFRACPTTMNKKWQSFLEWCLERLDEGQDLTKKYIEETIRLKSIYKANEFREQNYYEDCNTCNYKDMGGLICPLIWRRITYGPLVNNPEHYS